MGLEQDGALEGSYLQTWRKTKPWKVMTSFPSFRYDHVLWTGQVDCHRPQISLMKGTGSHSFCFHIRIARSYTHNRVKNLHMERHDDFPSARNQAASSQRSPNGKQNFLNNSRSVTSVGNSGRQLGSVFPRFRASIWRSCGQNAYRDLLNQSAGSYWATDATYCTG